MQGATAVIHCAMSDGASIMEGTRIVLEASRIAGVGKVVHLSTADVYSAAKGDLAEDCPQELIGDWYSDAKRQAERTCAAFSERGLPISILRPGIVYGPFCYAWTQRIGLRLIAGQVAELPARENGICNAVFVDDVVEACVQLRQPGVCDGIALNINGAERLHWNDYLSRFALALSAPPLRPASQRRTKLRSQLLEPARAVAKLLLKRYQKPVMALYARNAIANRIMKRVEGAFRANPEARELAVYARQTYFLDTLVRAKLPQVPCTPISEGLAISANYFRAFGHID
jgi:nucleoside-diphosphate-sugar epimerase